MGRVVGGTTVVNSGTCFRAPEEVGADDWARRFGIDWAGRGTDADFAEAEETLRVTPLDPATMGRNGQLAMEGAAALGVSGGRRPQRGDLRPVQLLPFGCPIDAKRGMHVSYLPRAVAAAAGASRGRGAAHPARERPRRRRRLRGWRGRRTGAPVLVRARRAVIAARRLLGTPELLLRSGLGNAAVGRNLHVHPACWVGARYEEEVRGWDGVMQSYYLDEWESRGVLLEATFTPPAFGGA